MSSSSKSEDATPLKQKKYNLHFKLEVVAYAEKYNKSKAAKVKNIPCSCVKDWMKQKVQLKAQLKASSSYSISSSKRLPRCQTSFEGQEFQQEAHQLGSSATSEETLCQSHDDPEGGTHFID